MSAPDAEDNRPTVLCIDDDGWILELCRMALREFCQVIPLNDGKEALGVAARIKPDLILLDVHMPPPNGLVVLGMLKMDPATKQIPVVMLTADGQLDTVSSARKMGARDFILKPVQPTGLQDRVRHLLGISPPPAKAEPPAPAMPAEVRRMAPSMSSRAPTPTPDLPPAPPSEPITATASASPQVLPASTDERAMFRSFMEDMENFSSLGEMIQREETLFEGYKRMLEIYMRRFDRTIGILLVSDWPEETLSLAAASGISEDDALTLVRRRHRDIRRTLALASRDHFRFSPDPEDPAQWIACALKTRKQLNGVFLFPLQANELFSSIPEPIAAALRLGSYELQIRQQLESAQRGMTGIARAFATSLDAKDPYTQGHAERVTLYSLAMNAMAARKLPEYYIQDVELRLAGLLHDVGKIGIPDAILGKAERLSETEFEHMKQHTSIGRRMLSEVPELKLAMQGTFHHERYDGRGYPDGLAGEEIPLVGRCLAVADTFDAMTSSRPYRKGMDPEAALAELRKNAGGQFDPLAVELFEMAWQNGMVTAILDMGIGDKQEEAEVKQAPVAVVEEPDEISRRCDDLLSRVDSVKFVSAVSHELISMVDDPSVSVDRVARRIEGDSALTARILQLANSSFYGFSRKIQSVEQSIIVLGIRQLKHMLYLLNARGMFEAARYDFIDMDALWKHALSTGFIAREFAAQIEKRRLPEEAFLAGLLHDIGKVVLLSLHPAQYAQVVDRVGVENITYVESEKAMFGLSHDEASGYLLTHWNLPAFLREPLRYHHTLAVQNPKQHLLSRLIMAADWLSHRAIEDGYEPGPWNPSVLGMIGLEPIDEEDALKFTRKVLAPHEELMSESMKSEVDGENGEQEQVPDAEEERL